VGREDEQRGVEQRPPRVAHEALEERAVVVGRGAAGQLARERADHVARRPARDHEVEAHDEHCRHYAVVAHAAPAAVEAAVGPHGVALRGAPHRELGEQERQSQHRHAEHVDEQKGAAAVVAGDVGEAPDVAQPHGAARGDEHGAQFAAQLGAVVRCVHGFQCFVESKER